MQSQNAHPRDTTGVQYVEVLFKQNSGLVFLQTCPPPPPTAKIPSHPGAAFYLDQWPAVKEDCGVLIAVVHFIVHV